MSGLAVALALAGVWLLGSWVLRLMTWAWALMAIAQLVDGRTVGAAFAVLAVVCWTLSHLLFRVRHGRWRTPRAARIPTLLQPRHHQRTQP